MNLGLCIAALAITATILFVVPVWVLPQSGVAAAVLLLCTTLATPFHGALLHEAIHGRLLAGERANRTMGRALAASFGVAFEVVRFGHLSHHRFNRHALDRPDVLEGDRSVTARIGFYAGLLGGMYAFELVATLMTLLPRRLLRPLVDRLAAGARRLRGRRLALRRCDRPLWRCLAAASGGDWHAWHDRLAAR